MIEYLQIIIDDLSYDDELIHSGKKGMHWRKGRKAKKQESNIRKRFQRLINKVLKKNHRTEPTEAELSAARRKERLKDYYKGGSKRVTKSLKRQTLGNTMYNDLIYKNVSGIDKGIKAYKSFKKKHPIANAVQVAKGVGSGATGGIIKGGINVVKKIKKGKRGR